VKLLNEAQEEQLKKIVAHLRKVRQEKSIRIEEIAAQTRIRPAFLQALEEGRFEDLPEPIYVKGFIRHYGDAIGLDGAALAQSLATAFSPPESEQHQENLDKKPNIYIPLVVPYILLLAGATFGLFYILNPQQRTIDSHSQSRPSSATSKHKTVSTPIASSPASSTPPRAISTKKTAPTPGTSLPVASTPTPTVSPTTPTASDVEANLELQDKSWLRVKADGKTVFEGVLNKGERKTWKAKKELTIRSGNAGAVLVSENKQKPKALGSVGSVTQVTFTAGTGSQQSKIRSPH